MIGPKIKIFKVFDFDINVDFSWVLIAVLVTWSLAKGYFPSIVPDLLSEQYWLLGVLGAFGLFFSIVFHELHHSLVAKHYGIRIRGITLFIFGGVAEMDNEPPTAMSEFWIAIAGPISSLYLALIFYVIQIYHSVILLPDMYSHVFQYLATINTLLAVFNMVPAFPLDGGRVLRAFLWKRRGNLKSATITASRSGSFFGTLFIVFALFNFIGGNYIVSIWWFLIGMFLKNAASMSLQQMLVKRILQGEPASKFMTSSPICLDLTQNLQEIVENYVYKTHHKVYPVVNRGMLVGIVTTRLIKEIPIEQWHNTSANEIMQPITPENTISPDLDAMDALSLMNRTGNSRLIVAKDGQLSGILSLKDILELLSLKIDLDSDVVSQ